MIRKTFKILAVALVAAFALSSTAQAATPKNTRHRTKHSSRVASGAPAPAAGKKPATKKKTSASQTRAKAGSTAKKNAPAVRRPTTKPR
jgi:hypothetical protein